MGQSNFLHSLGWAVLNSLWQMALLWIVFQVILVINPSARSSQKSSLAAAMLISGFGWFAYTLFSHWLSNPSTNSLVSNSNLGVTGYHELDTWLHTTLPFASIIYLVLLILPLLRFIRNYRYVQILRKYGLNKINVEWRLFVQRVSAQMGLHKPVRIWVSELITSPVTIGYLKPIILVPFAAINHLTPQQLEAVLLHELSHIKRHDYLINLVVNFIQTVLYYNPFVKLFVKCIERERERSCDESVIEFQYDPYGYASALLMLEKGNTITQSMAIAASGKKHDLLSRIESILGVEKKPFVSFNKIAGVFAGLLCVIALNALLILSKPETHTGPISFTHLTNPFYFISNDDEAQQKDVSPTPLLAVAENGTTNKSIITRASPVVKTRVIPMDQKIKINKVSSELKEFNSYFSPGAPSPALMNVNFVPVDVPELKHYQEEQVKEAVDATKIVLENEQWKEIEKKVADVLTMLEKKNLKLIYTKELEKVNWNKLEERLRQSYDNINWEKINEQLSTVIADLELDSLQIAYTDAVRTLSKAETFVISNKYQEIVHPDICIETLRDKKLEAERTLNKIKAIRNKKIIRL